MNRAETTAAYQAAVTSFGRFALQSRDLTATVQHALDLVADVLAAPMGSVIRRLQGPADFGVVAVHGPLGASPGQTYSTPPELEQLHTDSELLVVPDWATERRFRPTSLWRTAGVQASLSVPLLVDGRPWGRLGAFFPHPRPFARSEVDLAQSVAHMLAAAVERERVERAYAAMSAFGEFALTSTDLAVTVDRALDVVTGLLDAPMAAVTRLAGDEGRFVILAGHGAMAGQVGEGLAGPRQLALLPTGDLPLVIPDWQEHPDASKVTALLELGVRASVSAPLLVDGRMWGRVICFFTRPHRSSGTDAGMVQSVAHLLAAAIGRNRIESRLRETAEAFQRALLPAQLPDLPGIECAVRYLPAHGHQVGGDWYDVLDLPGGGAGLVMGDVEGHDSTAASIMGQVRAMVRTHAAEGHTPAEVMSRVNQFVIEHSERLVTCCFAELRPHELTLTGVSAGHPEPLLLASEGGMSPVRLARGPLLGLDPQAGYTERTSLLPAGATLVLVTGDLVDDVPSDLRPAAPGLTSIAPPAAGLPVEPLADLLVRRQASAGPQRDDAAVLVVRLVAPAAGLAGPDEQAYRLLRPSPESAPAARRFVRDILGGWNLTAIEDAAVLAVSELVTNAVVHTTSQIRLTLRRRGAQRLWMGVHDDSDRFLRPQTPTADDVSGRGLAIVESLADEWGVEPSVDGSGKTVWLELVASTGDEPAA